MAPSSKKSTIARIIVAAGPESADARWLTGFSAPDPFGVAVAPNGAVHLFVNILEAGRAHKEAKPSVQIHVIGGRIGDEIVRWARAAHLRAVGAAPTLPLGIARTLESAGIRVQLLEGVTPCAGRLVKTDDEIACIQKAQRAAVAAVRRARDILAESSIGAASVLRWREKTLTSERLRNEMENVLRAHGCASDDGLIAAGGRQAACPHENGHGPLRAGEAIVLDVFPHHCASGYWGDLTRTLMKGPPKNPRIYEMYAAVLATQKLALSLVRPGVAGRDVHQATASALAEFGFPLDTSVPGREKGMFHGLGHGVGLDIHEEPRLSPSSKAILAEGNVVTVEPGLYDPAVGGIRIEDTVVVRPDGPQILAACPRDMIVP